MLIYSEFSQKFLKEIKIPFEKKVVNKLAMCIYNWNKQFLVMDRKFEARLIESYISIEEFTKEYLEKQDQLNELLTERF